MKKSIYGLTLAICIMSLTACGSTVAGHLAGKALEGIITKDGQKEDKGSGEENKEPEEIEEEKGGEDKESSDSRQDSDADGQGAEEEGTSSETEDRKRMILKVEDNYLNEYRASQTVMEVKFNTLDINEEDFPELSASFNLLNQECESQVTEWKQMYLPYALEGLGQSYFYGYEYTQTMHLQRADEQVVSVVMENYDYTGGAHGETYFQSKTFDSATGRELTLSDVVTDLQGLADAVVKSLNEEYPVEYAAEGYRDVVESQILQQGLDNGEARWTLGYQGITFYYDSYELGAYSMGCPEAVVPYAQYPGLFKEEYTHIPDEYAVNLKDYGVAYEDTDGDGKLEAISVSAYSNQNSYSGLELNIYIDGTKNMHISEGWYEQAFLIRKKDGALYLYTALSGMDDMSFIHVFRLTGESAVFVGDVYGSFGNILMTDPGCFTLSNGMDALSSYRGYRNYCVGEDGMPEALEDAYTIEMYNYGMDEPEHHLTTKIPVPAWMISEDGSVSGTPEQLPAGTKLYFRKTDNATFVEMELEDGRRCQIRGDFTTWPKTINGMDENDCFDGILYAG